MGCTYIIFLKCVIDLVRSCAIWLWMQSCGPVARVHTPAVLDVDVFVVFIEVTWYERAFVCLGNYMILELKFHLMIIKDSCTTLHRHLLQLSLVPFQVDLVRPEIWNFWESRVVASNRLHECPQVRPSHAKHKGPPILWIQVAIGKNKQAFVLFWLKLVPNNYVKQIFGVELLSFSVAPDSCLDHFIFL